MAHEYDKSSKWLIQHHGDSILRLAGIEDIESWRALQAELVQPRRLPDGLLEVQFKNDPDPDLFILEIATYPEARLAEQLADDLMLVYLNRRIVAEVVTLILHPKGNVTAASGLELRSRRGLAGGSFFWRTVELWKILAVEALEAGDVGIVPWVPLMDLPDPPAPVFSRCRQLVDDQARSDERANLLAVAQIMAKLRYNEPALLDLLGGTKAMIESPLIQEMAAQKYHRSIEIVLEERFGNVPRDLLDRVQAESGEQALVVLLRAAVNCPDLDSFRAQLQS